MSFNLAQATLPVADLERAKRFYSGTLGLTIMSEDPTGVIYGVGNSTFYVYPSAGVASGTHTQMALFTSDIDDEVTRLKSLGVQFNEEVFPGLPTVNSIYTLGADKAAWFTDSEGNSLAFVQKG